MMVDKIRNYLKEIKKQNKIKGIQNIYFRTTKSKKTNSIYIQLITYGSNGKRHRKTLRISDHQTQIRIQHKLKLKNEQKTLKQIKTKINIMIKEIIKERNLSTVYDFKKEEK